MLSMLLTGALLFGYFGTMCYGLFEGQMRNIGLMRSVLLSAVLGPMAFPFIFSSKFKNDETKALHDQFHKNFFRNLLLQPFRIVASTFGSIVSLVSGERMAKDGTDRSLKWGYDWLFRDAVLDAQKQQGQGVNQSQDGTQQELEQEAGRDRDLQLELDRKEAELQKAREELSKMNDVIFHGCRKVGESYEFSSFVDIHGNTFVGVPLERMWTIKEAFESAGLRVFLVPLSEFNREYDKAVLEARGTKDAYARGDVSYVRSVERSVSHTAFYYDVVNSSVKSSPQHYGVEHSASEFENLARKADNINRFWVEKFKQSGGPELAGTTSLVPSGGMVLVHDADKLRLFFDGQELGVMRFCPERGPGREFEMDFSKLREALSREDPPGRIAMMPEMFSNVSGIQFSKEDFVDRISSMAMPDIANFMHEIVQHPDNVSRVLNCVDAESAVYMNDVLRHKEAREEAQEHAFTETKEVHITINRSGR